jgi:hypothetical protein
MVAQTDSSLTEVVQARVDEALLRSAERDAAHVTVDTIGSRVLLKGSVRSWAEHEDIEAAARATPGVTGVDNRVALAVKVGLADSGASHKTELASTTGHTTSRLSRRTVRGLVLAAVLASVWLLSTEPWGLGAYQLLMFTAPGALLGLGAAWMAHASTQTAWTWKSARRGAVIGAATLPPALAFVVALDGNARPQRLLVGFVYAAWVALVGGAAFALLHYPADDSENEKTPDTRS